MWYILCTEKILSYFGYHKRVIKTPQTPIYKEKTPPPVQQNVPKLRVRKNTYDRMDAYRFDI